MRFLSTLLLLLAVVCAIGLPYFVGHGLALHSAGWVTAGVVSGIVAALLIFVALRLSPGAERRRPHV